MATKKRAGLGRGLSALIPQAPSQDDRAIDVFFDGSAPTGRREASTNLDTKNQSATNDSLGDQSDLKKGTPKASNGKTSAHPADESEAASSAVEPDNADARAQADVSQQEFEGERDSSTTVDPIETSDLLPVPGVQLATLDPYRVVPNARQPRSEFDQEALDELTTSVREFGVFQPIVVRRIADDDPRREDGDFELIMGERRLRATKASGRTEIPAIIRQTQDEAMLRDALLENLHRAELNPLEEASAYRQLLDDFGISQEELATRIGRSRPRISNTLRLLKLPVDVQRKVAAGVLSAGHARAVLSVGEPAAMARLADRIVNEQLSVRDAETAAATTVSRSDKSTSQAAQGSGDSLSAHLDEVGERLGDRLNTRVKVVLRKTKGQISIDFASVADLNRILEAIGEPVEAPVSH